MPDLAPYYLQARDRIVELVSSLEPADFERPVPACPGWSVRDLLAHMVGLTADVIAGRTEGLATPPWTAAQVDARRDRTTDELLAEWDANLPGFVALLPAAGGPPVFDIVTHEQDLRGAIERPGARENEGLAFIVGRAGQVIGRKLEAAGVAPLAIVVDGEPAPILAGEGVAGATWHTDRFEMARTVTGRRAREQIQAMKWDGDPGPYVPHLAFLPMRETPLHE